MNYKALIAEITREHPDWKADQVKAELYRRVIQASPAYMDDSHVFPENVVADKER